MRADRRRQRRALRSDGRPTAGRREDRGSSARWHDARSPRRPSGTLSWRWSHRSFFWFIARPWWTGMTWIPREPIRHHLHRCAQPGSSGRMHVWHSVVRSIFLQECAAEQRSGRQLLEASILVLGGLRPTPIRHVRPARLRLEVPEDRRGDVLLAAAVAAPAACSVTIPMIGTCVNPAARVVRLRV